MVKMIYIIPTDTCFGMACALSDKKAYHRIYKLKKRDWNKPLALMVEHFDWLEEHTSLTNDQVTFLRKYKKPFTVLTDCDHVSFFLDYDDADDGDFLNNDSYGQIAFRVANMDIQKKLIKSKGPIFLTSANKSGKPEIQEMDLIEELYGEEKGVDIRGGNNIRSSQTSSDVFEFIGDTLELNYLRKS